MSQRVDLLKHLQRQENYVTTMSTFQGPYGAKLSSDIWRFQLMLNTNEWITKWVNAEETYGIRLSDYVKELRKDETEFEVPSLVLELGEEELKGECVRWIVPEVKTHEELVAALRNSQVGKTAVTVPELKEVMKKWMATWVKMGSKGRTPSEVLNSFDEDEMRSITTCNDLKDWMLGFQIVFVLKEGPIKELILKLMLQKYEGTELPIGKYNKKICGCTCGIWHRYFICIHSMAFNIMRDALPYPLQWDPRKFIGVVKNDVTGPLRKLSKVANALKPANAKFLCRDCCRRREPKKRKQKPVGKCATSPNIKRRKVTISSVTSPQNLTPKIPTKGHNKRKKESEKESKKESESEEGEDEEKEEGTDDIGLVGKVRGRVVEELVEEDDGTRSGCCEACNTRVRLRKDMFGVGDGNEHTLPETLYIAGFRRMMTRRGSIMGGFSPEPQCKDQLRPSETTPSSSRKR